MNPNAKTFASPALQAKSDAAVAARAAEQLELAKARTARSALIMKERAAKESEEDRQDVAYARAEYDRLSREADAEIFYGAEDLEAIAEFVRKVSTLDTRMRSASRRVAAADEECERLRVILARTYGVIVPARRSSRARWHAAVGQLQAVLLAAVAEHQAQGVSNVLGFLAQARSPKPRAG
jgi:hypothetical protein